MTWVDTLMSTFSGPSFHRALTLPADVTVAVVIAAVAAAAVVVVVPMVVAWLMVAIAADISEH